MKQCTYCGKEYPDEAVACGIDNQPLRQVASAPPPPAPLLIDEKQRIVDAEHMKLLSIFHFVVGGLALLGVVFLLLHCLIMSAVFSNPELWKTQNSPNPMPKDFFEVFVWFYLVMGLIFATACIVNILSGIFLRQRKHRVFSLVVAGLDCIQVPFGTVLGVFTLIVLSRDSVRQLYAPGAALLTLP
jgi:hypothetical protein